MKNYSFISLLLCSIVLTISGSFFYPRWQKSGSEAQISWDAGGYYWYLPSAFIYHDLKGQGFKDSIMQKYQPTPPDDFQYGHQHESGNYVIRYTMGTALLEIPFFFIAHFLAEPLGFPADGFSIPYQFMIYLGGLLFALAGIWYLRKLLLLYYSDKVVAIVLILLVLGTNYLNYAGIDVGMTHTWLFTLYVLILLNTHYYYRTFKVKYAISIGLLIGITALVRPPEIISVLIPLLWNIESLSLAAIKKRCSFLLLYRKHLFLAAALCLFILSWQFIYWKYASGQWFVYTYQNQGFSWLKPHLKQYALNYQCGWLWYTPMMFVAIFGIALFFKSGKNKVAILTVIFINYYIVAAWDAWDYGGRAMVQNYALLVFPLAEVVRFALSRKFRLGIVAPILLLCTYFNLWWTYQAHGGSLIGGVPATKAYYYATIFRYNLPVTIQKLRDNEDLYRKAIRNPHLVYDHRFTPDSLGNNLIIVGDKQYSLSVPVKKFPYKWIRAYVTIAIDQKEWNVWYMTQLIIKQKKGNEVLKENNLRLQRFIENKETRTIAVDAIVRDQSIDTLEIVLRNDNNGSLPCNVRQLKIIGFND